MPTDMSKLKPARKSKDRPLGFRTGDWLVSSLTSGGYFAGYVVGTAGASILLKQVRKRFEPAPVLVQLDSVDEAELVGVLRLELGSYRLSHVLRAESREPRVLSDPLPLVYAEPTSWINRLPRFYWYERPDSPWHIRVTDEVPHEEFGEQAKVDGANLADYLDRLTPDRELRYSEGDWYGFQIGKNRWAAGFVEDMRLPAQLILRVPYIVFDREITPDDVSILRSCQASKPLVVWDDGIQSGKWTRLAWEPPLGDGEPGLHGVARLRILDPELSLQEHLDALGVIGRTSFIPPEITAGDLSYIHSADLLAMNLRGGSVLLPSRPWRPDEKPKPPVKKRGPRKKPYREGDWFLVPLKHGGYGLGRIARCGSDTIMVYVFGGRHFSTPEPAYLRGLRPSSAVDVMFVDDEGLKKGDWQILGQADGWRRDEWAPPLFSFALDQITWSEIREYPDGDPFGVTSSRRTPRDEARQYPGDGIQCRTGAEFEFDLWALPNNEAIQSWAISFGDGMSKSRPEDHVAYNAPADGDWFALRLDQGGWGLGRVARTDGFLMVAYLFKHRFEAVPELTRIQLPSAADAILAQRTNLEMSPLGEVVWLGCGSEWDPTAWPIPRFKHEIRGMGEHAVGLSYTFDPVCLGRVVACRRATIVELESLAAFKQFTLFGMAFWLDAAIDPRH